MCYKKIFLVCSFILFCVQVSADTKRWSLLQGNLNWSDAKAKCNSIGMRLPTLEELKISFEKEEIANWKKDGTTYWSSNEISSDRAYYISLLNGSKFSLAKNKTTLVRCIQ